MSLLAADDADPPVFSAGDQRFLDDLDAVPALRDFGRRLLIGVRSRSAGSLSYKERSGKFVESPDNFWTVKIQPRDRSLRITVRGRPNTFPATGLQLVDDMAGYSSFKVKAGPDVDSALATILRASRR